MNVSMSFRLSNIGVVMGASERFSNLRCVCIVWVYSKTCFALFVISATWLRPTNNLRVVCLLFTEKLWSENGVKFHGHQFLALLAIPPLRKMTVTQ